ncbi:hypothetical protein AFLA_007774 [Aspergillus flavus NRRL3357]|nr:hypothetical protein AFLA_007774 [Aspergillus flavus NRRL3357]
MGPKRTVEWTASVGLYPMEVELRQHPYERSGKLGWCRRMGPSICTGIDQAAVPSSRATPNGRRKRPAGLRPLRAGLPKALKMRLSRIAQSPAVGSGPFSPAIHRVPLGIIEPYGRGGKD